MDTIELNKRLAFSLEDKISLTKERIKEWYEYWEGKVYVSFSGGKDSTVLLDLVRSIYPKVEGVFVNTGLEFPEILSFVKTLDNIITLIPKMRFKDVINKYGYPVISKENAEKIYQIRNYKSIRIIHTRLFGDEKGNGKLPKKWRFLIDAPFKISSNCCNVLKKGPIKKYEKESGNKSIIGTMVDDSALRKISYLRTGCNSFSGGKSLPISFWSEENIWEYIRIKKLPYSSIYDMGYKNTGCIFCMFGIHLDKSEKNKFQLMKDTHPKQYNYCINKLKCGEVLDYISIPYT